MVEETTTNIVQRSITAYSTVEEEMRFLQALTPNARIDVDVVLYDVCDSHFSLTFEIQKLLIDKKSNIHRLKVRNHCEVGNEYLVGFNFFVQFLRANNGDTKHFEYDSGDVKLSLEHTNKIADALQSNNYCDIKSFSLSIDCILESFLTIWNAMLDNCVQDINIQYKTNWYLDFSENEDDRNYNYNNNNNVGSFDFSNLCTNTTVKKLQLSLSSKSDLIGTNLFDSIKTNKTLEKLHILVGGDCAKESETIDSVRTSLREMVLENITLLDISVPVYNLDMTISIQTQLNRMWKRYIMKCGERIAAAAAAATAINNTCNNILVADDDDLNTTVVDDEREQKQDEEVEEKKMKKIDKEEKMTEMKEEMWICPLFSSIVFNVREQQQDEEEEENSNNNKKIKEEKMMKRKKEMLVCLETFTKPLMRNELIYQFLTKNADMYNVQ